MKKKSFLAESLPGEVWEPLSSMPSALFVGRERELGRLRTLLDQAVDGMGSFVVINGEAGLGKSALVRHFAAEAAEKGALCISENFARAQSYEPYAAFLRLLEGLHVSKLKPSLLMASVGSDDSVGDGNDGGGPGSWDLQSLYSLQALRKIAQQRLVSALLEATHERVVLIILGDAHLAPSTAWQFIHYLSKSIVEHRLLLIVSLRQDGRELQQSRVPPYAEILQRMSREGLIERIQLRRFREKEIRLLLRRTFVRTDFSSRFVPFLQEASGGLPGEVIRCLEVMKRKRFILQQNGVWFDNEDVSVDSLVTHLERSHSLGTTVKLLDDLSDKQRSISQVAALLNEPFDHRILSEVTKIPRLKVLKELVALEAGKVLAELEDGTYGFKLPTIRTAILEAIPPERRSLMHREIAIAVEGADYLSETERTYILAHHYRQTDDKRSAFRYLYQAGRLAVRSYAFSEAREYFEQALALLNFVPEEMPGAEAVYLLLRLCWLHRVLGDWEDSIQCCKAAEGLYAGGGDAKIRHQILIQKGLTYFRLNDWDSAIASFEECLFDQENASLFDLALADFGLGTVHFELADYAASRRYLEKSLLLAKELDNQHLLANIYNNLGAIENVCGRRLRAIAMYSQSIPIFERLGEDSGLARIYHNIGMAYADEKDWERANEFYGKSLSLSDSLGLVPLKSITFLNRAMALAYLRRFDEAREYNFKARRLLERLKDELGMAEYHKVQGIIEREQARWSEARTHFDTALEKFDAFQNPLGVAETQSESGMLALAMGHREEAIRWFERSHESYGELGLREKVKIVEHQLEQVPRVLSTTQEPA